MQTITATTETIANGVETIEMVEITCTCACCVDNAERLGKTVLGARVPVRLTNGLKLTKAGNLSKQATHSFVYMANDPNKVSGEGVRMRTGIRPL